MKICTEDDTYMLSYTHILYIDVLENRFNCYKNWCRIGHCPGELKMVFVQVS